MTQHIHINPDDNGEYFLLDEHIPSQPGTTILLDGSEEIGTIVRTDQTLEIDLATEARAHIFFNIEIDQVSINARSELNVDSDMKVEKLSLKGTTIYISDMSCPVLSCSAEDRVEFTSGSIHVSSELHVLSNLVTQKAELTSTGKIHLDVKGFYFCEGSKTTLLLGKNANDVHLADITLAEGSRVEMREGDLSYQSITNNGKLILNNVRCNSAKSEPDSRFSMFGSGASLTIMCSELSDKSINIREGKYNIAFTKWKAKMASFQSVDGEFFASEISSDFIDLNGKITLFESSTLTFSKKLNLDGSISFEESHCKSTAPNNNGLMHIKNSVRSLNSSIEVDLLEINDNGVLSIDGQNSHLVAKSIGINDDGQLKIDQGDISVVDIAHQGKEIGVVNGGKLKTKQSINTASCTSTDAMRAIFLNQATLEVGGDLNVRSLESVRSKTIVNRNFSAISGPLCSFNASAMTVKGEAYFSIPVSLFDSSIEISRNLKVDNKLTILGAGSVLDVDGQLAFTYGADVKSNGTTKVGRSCDLRGSYQLLEDGKLQVEDKLTIHPQSNLILQGGHVSAEVISHNGKLTVNNTRYFIDASGELKEKKRSKITASKSFTAERGSSIVPEDRSEDHMPQLVIKSPSITNLGLIGLDFLKCKGDEFKNDYPITTSHLVIKMNYSAASLANINAANLEIYTPVWENTAVLTVTQLLFSRTIIEAPGFIRAATRDSKTLITLGLDTALSISRWGDLIDPKVIKQYLLQLITPNSLSAAYSLYSLLVSGHSEIKRKILKRYKEEYGDSPLTFNNFKNICNKTERHEMLRLLWGCQTAIGHAKTLTQPTMDELDKRYQAKQLKIRQEQGQVQSDDSMLPLAWRDRFTKQYLDCIIEYANWSNIPHVKPTLEMLDKIYHDKRPNGETKPLTFRDRLSLTYLGCIKKYVQESASELYQQRIKELDDAYRNRLEADGHLQDNASGPKDTQQSHQPEIIQESIDPINHEQNQNALNPMTESFVGLLTGSPDHATDEQSTELPTESSSNPKPPTWEERRSKKYLSVAAAEVGKQLLDAGKQLYDAGKKQVGIPYQYLAMALPSHMVTSLNLFNLFNITLNQNSWSLLRDNLGIDLSFIRTIDAKVYTNQGIQTGFKTTLLAHRFINKGLLATYHLHAQGDTFTQDGLVVGGGNFTVLYTHWENTPGSSLIGPTRVYALGKTFEGKDANFNVDSLDLQFSDSIDLSGAHIGGDLTAVTNDYRDPGATIAGEKVVIIANEHLEHGSDVTAQDVLLKSDNEPVLDGSVKAKNLEIDAPMSEEDAKNLIEGNGSFGKYQPGLLKLTPYCPVEVDENIAKRNIPLDITSEIIPPKKPLHFEQPLHLTSIESLTLKHPISGPEVFIRSMKQLKLKTGANIDGKRILLRSGEGDLILNAKLTPSEFASLIMDHPDKYKFIADYQVNFMLINDCGKKPDDSKVEVNECYIYKTDHGHHYKLRDSKGKLHKGEVNSLDLSHGCKASVGHDKFFSDQNTYEFKNAVMRCHNLGQASIAVGSGADQDEIGLYFRLGECHLTGPVKIGADGNVLGVMKSLEITPTVTTHEYKDEKPPKGALQHLAGMERKEKHITHHVHSPKMISRNGAVFLEIEGDLESTAGMFLAKRGFRLEVGGDVYLKDLITKDVSEKKTTSPFGGNWKKEKISKEKAHLTIVKVDEGPFCCGSDGSQYFLGAQISSVGGVCKSNKTIVISAPILETKYVAIKHQISVTVCGHELSRFFETATATASALFSNKALPRAKWKQLFKEVCDKEPMIGVIVDCLSSDSVYDKVIHGWDAGLTGVELISDLAQGINKDDLSGAIAKRYGYKDTDVKVTFSRSRKKIKFNVVDDMAGIYSSDTFTFQADTLKLLNGVNLVSREFEFEVKRILARAAELEHAYSQTNLSGYVSHNGNWGGGAGVDCHEEKGTRYQAPRITAQHVHFEKVESVDGQLDLQADETSGSIKDVNLSSLADYSRRSDTRLGIGSDNVCAVYGEGSSTSKGRGNSSWKANNASGLTINKLNNKGAQVYLPGSKIDEVDGESVKFKTSYTGFGFSANPETQTCSSVTLNLNKSKGKQAPVVNGANIAKTTGPVKTHGTGYTSPKGRSVNATAKLPDLDRMRGFFDQVNQAIDQISSSQNPVDNKPSQKASTPSNDQASEPKDQAQPQNIDPSSNEKSDPCNVTQTQEPSKVGLNEAVKQDMNDQASEPKDQAQPLNIETSSNDKSDSSNATQTQEPSKVELNETVKQEITEQVISEIEKIFQNKISSDFNDSDATTDQEDPPLWQAPFEGAYNSVKKTFFGTLELLSDINTLTNPYGVFTPQYEDALNNMVNRQAALVEAAKNCCVLIAETNAIEQIETAKAYVPNLDPTTRSELNDAQALLLDDFGKRSGLENFCNLPPYEKLAKFTEIVTDWALPVGTFKAMKAVNKTRGPFKNAPKSTRPDFHPKPVPFDQHNPKSASSMAPRQCLFQPASPTFNPAKTVTLPHHDTLPKTLQGKQLRCYQVADLEFYAQSPEIADAGKQLLSNMSKDIDASLKPLIKSFEAELANTRSGNQLKIAFISDKHKMKLDAFIYKEELMCVSISPELITEHQLVYGSNMLHEYYHRVGELTASSRFFESLEAKMAGDPLTYQKFRNYREKWRADRKEFINNKKPTAPAEVNQAAKEIFQMPEKSLGFYEMQLPGLPEENLFDFVTCAEGSAHTINVLYKYGPDVARIVTPNTIDLVLEDLARIEKSMERKGISHQPR